VSNAFQQETNVEIKRQLQWMLAEVQWTLAAVQEQLALEFQPALFSVEGNAVPVRSFCPFSSASAQIIMAQNVASPPGLSASDRYSLGCLQGQSKQTQTDKGYRDSWGPSGSGGWQRTDYRLTRGPQIKVKRISLDFYGVLVRSGASAARDLSLSRLCIQILKSKGWEVYVISSTADEETVTEVRRQLEESKIRPLLKDVFFPTGRIGPDGKLSCMQGEDIQMHLDDEEDICSEIVAAGKRAILITPGCREHCALYWKGEAYDTFSEAVIDAICRPAWK